MFHIEHTPVFNPLIQMILYWKEAVAQDTHMRNKRSTAPPLGDTSAFNLRIQSELSELDQTREVRMGQLSDKTQTTDRTARD